MARPGDIEVVVRYSHFDKAKGALRDAVEQVIEKSAWDVAFEAKNTVAVDTGALKNFITVTQDSGDRMVRYVVAPKFYAPYLEFGTRHMPAKPFLIPAAQRVKPVMVSALRQLGFGAK